jgi:DNA-directed RNA polymerase specialized sigma24 family protein
MPDPERFVREHQTSLWRYLRLLGANAADAEYLLQETSLRFLRRTQPHPAAAATACCHCTCRHCRRPDGS